MKEMETLLARSAFYRGLSVTLRRPNAQTVKRLAMQEHHRLPEIVRLLTKGGSGPLHEAVQRWVKG